MRGRLYVVATPIGNLQDITLRALEVLKSVSAIASEDTRVSIKILNYYGIRKKLISNFKGNEAKRVSEIIEILQKGEDVALISDAGTPLISDPGKVLVASLREKGYEVIPIPGPSSVTASLSVCGFEDHPFTFYGFVPKKEKEKMTFWEEIKKIKHTALFFESPHRIKKTLCYLKENFPERDIFVAREMTKKFESYLTNPDLEDVPEKGEFVIILSPPLSKNVKFDEKDIEKNYLNLLDKGMSHNQAVKELSKKLKISKRLLYNNLLKKGD